MGMTCKKENPNFARVWILVPRAFLSNFDREIDDMYPSRSEAIRRGMRLVLKEAKAIREEGRS